MIKFVRETEQLDFAEAVEWLAERFRVPLEYDESSPQLDAARQRRERLHALLERAAGFFEHALWETDSGAPVRAYLAERGLNEEVCREYRLGLALGGLARKARQGGFTDGELLAAGLVNRRGNDWFPAGRLVFPLADSRGRVLGFGARRLRDDDPLRGEVRQLAGGRALPQVRPRLRARPLEGRDREAGPRARRRGLHRRARAAAGRASSRSSRRWGRR